jgi:hypothetical protein
MRDGTNPPDPVPIAIFAFKRLDLLMKTLSSLERCHGFPGGSIHVFSDAARAGEPVEAERVEAVRSYLRVWCARNQATLHEAARNQGLRSAIVGGVSFLLSTYERIIVLEDDIVVSKYFLEFMHVALERFRDSEKVMQVSGYFTPHHCTLPDVGLLHVTACWGWGTWRRAWRYYRDDAKSLLVDISGRSLRKFNVEDTYDYYGSLQENAEGTQNTWSVRWYASVFLKDGLVVFPGQSLTRNIGFGDDGTNCRDGAMAQVFMKQRIMARVPDTSFIDEHLVETKLFRDQLTKFYSWQNLQWSQPSAAKRWSARIRRVYQFVRWWK